MKYDFTIQKRLLNTSLRLLKEQNLLNISAFGGGTALAALYWNHRYSTDIDFFIYGEENKIAYLKPRNWNDKSKKAMKKINYKDGNIKYNGIYLEYAITDEYKIQFMDVLERTSIPYHLKNIWHHNINIETIEEIISKKIHFRGEKGNARDIFDVAVAFHKNPNIVNTLNLKKEKIKSFLDTIHDIFSNESLLENYLSEIRKMNPHPDYEKLSKNAVKYLFLFLSNYYSYLQEEKVLNSKQCKKLDSKIYEILD